MGRIFIGLVKCGAWGCFDEFNRLEEAVLSAVSTQIQSIQAAIKNKIPSIELLGRSVSSLWIETAKLVEGVEPENLSLLVITLYRLYMLPECSMS